MASNLVVDFAKESVSSRKHFHVSVDLIVYLIVEEEIARLAHAIKSLNSITQFLTLST